MKEYVVIWNKTESKFTEYGEAVEYAEHKTEHETEHFTALIIMREFIGNDVKIPLIMGCTWISGSIFELVNLIM